ncbi:MAG: hypothetical protein M3162_03425 [Thermoproteota archaeon]|nr:hypothetical protein [Thermoproteota archaeon]
MLEIFNRNNIPVELNLICQFDNQNYFEAIFNGYNKYRFTKVIPIIGHSYQRQITFNKLDLSIEYLLMDLDLNKEEKYTLELDGQPNFSYGFSLFFTGIEWWNRIGHFAYPIRFHAQISDLMYGLNDNPEDSESKIFFPIDSLKPNRDNISSSYPIEFEAKIKNNCLCYSVHKGNCRDGFENRLVS